MPRLPDRFDLWVRKARTCPDPGRQLDYILGALAGLPEWHFLNVGTPDRPQIATTEMEDSPVLLVFSDAERVLEVAKQLHLASPREAPPVVVIPGAEALTWCLGPAAPKWESLLINPGEDAALVPREQVETFAREWRARGGSAAAGFWIPNLTSEEEDFWQEHGL
jgi:hypothetical protein